MTRARFYQASGAIVALAAGLRLFALGFWRQLLFDENYYVKDAISLRAFGAELQWRKGASSSIESGVIPEPLHQPELISHPPLGKLLISLGFDWFGATNPIGWRIASALAGILCVVLVIALAKLIFENEHIALLAGLLMAVDGTAILMSRVALLDGFLGFFVLLAWWLYLRARNSGHGALWLLGAGLSLGAATAVKWSGLWFALVILLHAAFTYRAKFSALWRLAAGVVGAYLLGWLPWFFSDNGLDRGFGSHPMAAFVQLHIDMFNYNIDYRSIHPSVADPWQWLTLAKPTLLAVEPHATSTAACAAEQNCKVIVSSLGNPMIWWLGVAAVLALVWAVTRRTETRGLPVLLGVAAGWLPWLLFGSRTTFHFYVIAFEGFLVIALAWWLAKLPPRRLAIATMAIVAISFVFLPYQLGTAQPEWYWQLTRWLPEWQ